MPAPAHAPRRRRHRSRQQERHVHQRRPDPRGLPHAERRRLAGRRLAHRPRRRRAGRRPALDVGQLRRGARQQRPHARALRPPRARAATSETILLLGESGTGKEVLARAIHAASPRSGGPFVVFDCSAVAPNLIEAELFGYTKGAFTGAQTARAGLLEEASGGTLFLDEIGELPIDLQPKLLRALEARQVRRVGAAAYTSFDARVIAATHRDLQGRIASGTFRADLYYRLAVVEAVVPPLRERKEDIPLLVERFLAAQVPPRSIADLPPNALELLRGHHWPGNVRELRNTVARLVLFPHLAEEAIVKVAPRPSDMGVGQFAALPLREARDMVVEQFERTFIAMKLRDHGGNVARAAASMGVSRQLVHRLMERYGIRSKG
ncbi:sigma-54 interaction domain-containing protein [Sorangium sp. So ce1128]